MDGILDSILDSTKKALGLTADYTEFDPEIIMHINAVFSTLNQLGIGPIEGFEIEDAVATWDSFTLGNPRYNSVKQYVYLKVRLVFDPPSTSFVLEAMNRTAQELEWRLNVIRETDLYLLPVVVIETP